MSDFSDKFDLSYIDWVIIGAETGNRKGKVLPKKEWLLNLLTTTNKYGIPVFLKNSLDDYVTTLLRDLQQYPSLLLKNDFIIKHLLSLPASMLDETWVLLPDNRRIIYSKRINKELYKEYYKKFVEAELTIAEYYNGEEESL